MNGRLTVLLAIGSAAATLAPPALAENPPGDVSATTPGSTAEPVKVPEVPSEYLVHEGQGFGVAYHPGARERVRAVLPQLVRIREELRAALGAPVLEEVEIRVVALPVEMQRVAPSPDRVERGGIAVPTHRLVVVSADSGRGSGDLERAIRHHLAHLAVSEAAAGGAVPPWFHEGFAVHFAGEARAFRVQTLELSTLSGEAPSLHAFGDGPVDEREVALAADFVRFASREPGRVPSVVSGVKDGLSFDRALESAFGSKTPAIERAWREDVARRYAFLPVVLLGLLVWLAVAVVARIRRRAVRPAEDPRADRAAVRGRRLRLRGAARLRDARVEGAPPPPKRDEPEIGVPKVEHDGRWHTLH